MKAQTKKHAKRTLGSVVVVLGGLVVPMLQPPSPAGAVVAPGACRDMTIELTGAVEPLLPAWASWTLSGSGVCLIDSDTDAPVTVGGLLSGFEGHDTVSCLAAVLGGTLTLDLTADGYGTMTGNITVAVSAAGVAPLVSVKIANFAAAGVFLQDPFDTAACVDDDGASSLTWTGALVFNKVS